MKKLRASLIAMFAVLASANLNANSQCVVMTTDQAKAFAQFVLLGRVVAIERGKLHSTLTVEVERVWKGMTPKRMTLYQSHQSFGLTGIITVFKVDQTYVIFAGQAFRPTVFPFYVDDCWSKSASAFNLDELGDSTPPQQ